MELLLATQQSGILKPFAWILGKILEAIYFIFSSIGIESIGLCIIVFTVVIRMLMLPSTIKQQKFSKLNSVMNPEIQAIQKKYKKLIRHHSLHSRKKLRLYMISMVFHLQEVVYSYLFKCLLS